MSTRYDSSGQPLRNERQLTRMHRIGSGFRGVMKSGNRLGRFARGTLSLLNMGKWSENLYEGLSGNPTRRAKTLHEVFGKSPNPKYMPKGKFGQGQYERMKNEGAVDDKGQPHFLLSSYLKDNPDVNLSTRTAGGYASTLAGNLGVYGTIGGTGLAIANKPSVADPPPTKGVYGGKPTEEDKNRSKRRAEIQKQFGNASALTKPIIEPLLKKHEWVGKVAGQLPREKILAFKKAMETPGEEASSKAAQQMHDMLIERVMMLDPEQAPKFSSEPYMIPGIFGGEGDKFVVFMVPPDGEKSQNWSVERFRYQPSDGTK